MGLLNRATWPTGFLLANSGPLLPYRRIRQIVNASFGHSASDRPAMPSLFRFLTLLAVIAGIGYGVLFALARLDPSPREITVTVPPDRYLKN